MRISSVLAALFLLVPSGFAVEATIRDLRLEGNRRIPQATVVHYLQSVPGRSFDATLVEADLRKLHSLGFFDSIEVRAEDAPDGRVDLVFRVRERPFLAEVGFTGVSGAQERRLRELLRGDSGLRPLSPFHRAKAANAARVMEAYLRGRKHPHAEVRVAEEPAGKAVCVVFDVRPGPRLALGRIAFRGNSEISDGTLRRQLEHTRTESDWMPWTSSGSFRPSDLGSDLEKVRRYYQTQGYAAAEIGKPEVYGEGARSRSPFSFFQASERPELSLEIPVVEGARFDLESVRLEGELRSCETEIKALVAAMPVPSRYDLSVLETMRQKITDTLGRSGYALAQVRLEQITDPNRGKVRAIYSVDPGNPVVVGKIDFEGNRRIADRHLRRELRLEEGELFDSSRLDQSIVRLNRGNLLDGIRREDVSLQHNVQTNELDITFRVKERNRQGLYATGGAAGGGYLGILYSALDFLGLGEAITLELDGGASQSNILLNIVGRHFVGSPFNVGLSLFHRATRIDVASLIPDTDDVVRVFRRRSAGFGLTGSYPISARADVGLAFSMEQVSFADLPSVEAGAAVSSLKTQWSPSFSWDSTLGSADSIRGTRLHLGQTLSGSSLIGSPKAAASSLRLARYLAAPGRESHTVAFQLQAGRSYPIGGSALSLQQRLFPGDEIVRGFRRGSLTPWVSEPAGETISIRPGGADAMMGFSTEYRVPLRGPMSSLAFVDLGWSQLAGNRLGEDSSRGVQLIEATSNVVRLSLGGELRLRLPIVRQPARWIFAWNPLRLSQTFSSPSGVLKLADPRGSMRFALGGPY